jgi:hypothetical protein
LGRIKNDFKFSILAVNADFLNLFFDVLLQLRLSDSIIIVGPFFVAAVVGSPTKLGICCEEETESCIAVSRGIHIVAVHRLVAQTDAGVTVRHRPQAQ